MKTVKQLFVCILSIMLLSNVVLSASIGLSANETSVSIVEESDNGITLKFSIAEIEHFIVESREGTFVQLMIPGFQYANKIGNPKLPMMNQMIEVPPSAVIEYEILDFSTEEINLSDYGITHLLMPAQPSLSKSDDPNEVPFEYNRALYQVDEFYSISTGEIEDLGLMRYNRINVVKTAPISYNPVSNKIRVMNNLKIKIHFNNRKIAQDQELKRIYYSPFFEQSFSKIINHREDPNDLTRFPQKYVIVTPDQFLSVMQPFIDWKTQQGFEIILETTQNLGNNTAIKNYIHQLYNNATLEDPAPSFVLLVGDTPQLQPFNGTTGGHVTDLPFVAVTTGDFLPDIYLGRFSANNPDELQTQVDKTLYYEKYEIDDPSYLNNVSLIAGWDYSHTPTHGYPTILYGEQYYFNAAHGYNEVNMYLTTGSGQFVSEIINDVSQGLGFINYTAHGSSTSWSDPSFTISNINNLTNIGKYTLAVGNCCLTANFQTGTCFGEVWLRAENKGAIGYIGGINSTYWDEDVYWSTGFYSHAGSGITPTFEETTMGAYDAPYISDLTTQAALIYTGNFAVSQSSSSLIHYYWEIYELFGDPSLMPYWSEPDPMTATHLPIIPIGSTSFVVTVPGVYRALLGLTFNGELVGSAMTDEYGDAEILFDSPLTEVGTYKLTITAQNRQPIVTDLEAIVPANISVSPSAINISTSTDVEVTVLDSDNQPIEGVRVWAACPNYFVDTVVTNASGVATLNVNTPYGPCVFLKGKRVEDPYILFTDTLNVNGGLLLTNANLAVTTSFGLVDTFSINLPGMIEGTADQTDILVSASVNGGNYFTSSSNTLEITPGNTGNVSAFIIKDGYEFYQEGFPIIIAKGSLNGYVKDQSNNPISGAMVRGYINDEQIFDIVTNALGYFSVPNEIRCGEIQLEIKAFGYNDFNDTFFINFGENTTNVVMSPAPSSNISGTVQNINQEPLTATLKFYRIDTGDLYLTLYSEAGQNGSYSGTLVNFDYLVKVKAIGYKQLDTMLVISQDTTVNFTLTLPSGILVLGADSKGYYWDKERTLPMGPSNNSKSSADEICDLLTQFNLEFTYESSSSTNPDEWLNYSGVIFCKGADANDVTQTMQDALIDHVNNDGILLIEGGEIGYNHQTGSFATTVLHIADWNHDQSGNIHKHQASHPLMNEPNVLPLNINHDYSQWGDEDAVEPLNNEEMIGTWTSYTNDASIIAYENQVVFLAFNFEKIVNAEDKSDLLQNILQYLQIFNFIPVELVSFNAEIQDGNIILNWETATETNNMGFDIENSFGDNSWSKIGFVEGKGTTTEKNYYSFTVSEKVNGKVYFRLKQIDFDGSFNYSDELLVDVSLSPKEYALSQNYPNPFNPSTTIKYALPSTSNVKIVVYNMLGQTVEVLVNQVQKTGYYEYNWDAGKYASGIYVYMLDASSVVENKQYRNVKKMLLVK